MGTVLDSLHVGVFCWLHWVRSSNLIIFSSFSKCFLFFFRVFTLTWRNAFLSITRYVVNTATHKGSPYSNRTVIKWFVVAIAFTIAIFTIIPMYHVTTHSIQILTFCARFNCQDDDSVTYPNNSICLIESPNPPDMFSLEWSLTLAPCVFMFLGAALGYAADWKLKVFVEKQKIECQQLGIPIIDLDDTIPVKATRISMSSIVISILAFPLRFFVGAWAFTCFLEVMLSLQAPMLVFLIFKHQQENLESPWATHQGKFGAIENSRFIKEFPQNEVKTRRRPTKIVKRVQWKVGHWGKNGSYHEPTSLGCKEFCKWDSQNREKSHLHFNTMVTPDFSKDEQLPLNVDNIVSQDESQDYVTDCLSHDIYTQNLPQDVSHQQESRKLSNNVVSQYLSASEDISHCISNEYYQALSPDEPQNLSLCEVSVHMPECIPKGESQCQDKSKGLSQIDPQEQSVYTSEFASDDNLTTTS